MFFISYASVFAPCSYIPILTNKFFSHRNKIVDFYFKFDKMWQSESQKVNKNINGK